MINCLQCLETPCLCGHEYRRLPAEKRQRLVKAVLATLEPPVELAALSDRLVGRQAAFTPEETGQFLASQPLKKQVEFLARLLSHLPAQQRGQVYALECAGRLGEPAPAKSGLKKR